MYRDKTRLPDALRFYKIKVGLGGLLELVYVGFHFSTSYRCLKFYSLVDWLLQTLLLYYRYITVASLQKYWVEEKNAETRDSASRGCGCRLYENCRMAECTPLDQPHCRTRLFSNAGSGKVIRDRFYFLDGSLGVRPSLSTRKIYQNVLLQLFPFSFSTTSP